MRSCNRTLALLVLFALPGVCAPARIAAQTAVESNVPGAGFDQPDQPVQSATGAPTLHVYSRETLVDVTATDDKGNPVHGLSRTDFSLTEDGVFQPIRSFREFAGAKQSAPPPPSLIARAPNQPPQSIYTNRQTATGPLTVLLLDDINGGDNAQVRLGLASYFKKMAPGSQAALLALADHLTVLQAPTTDPARLRQVANVIVRPYSAVSDPCSVQIGAGRQTLDELDQIAAYLSHIDGRKNLIWIGSGIPDMIFNTCENWNLALRKTYDQLEDAEVTVYPMDSSGVQGLPPPAELNGSPRDYGKQVATQNVGALAGLSKTHLSQEAVAEATGGQAFYNTNDISGAIARVANIGSNYYTLSYAPPSVAYDGRYYAIDIQVDKPGVHLVYRKGYSAEDPALLANATPAAVAITGTPDLLASALAPTMPPATQLLFDVKAEPSTEPPSATDAPILGALDPKLKDKPLTRYGFLFTMPAAQIAFAAVAGGTYNGSVEFGVAAYDSDGHLLNSRSQTMPFPLTTAEYGEFVATPFQFFQQLDLPPGLVTLRVGVLDGVSKKVGTVDIPVVIPKNPVRAVAP